ncbi:Estradiol 17-beta-dehydrogenase 12-B [Fasciola gigantica]|uniref:Estradiol 17-beta-dehydrogenase 12-B n=1 Tax=Fasciola gigantica TaxID=46835 RepID=A0A504Y6Q5_FASGI|nr:Estradiol 17-beta-dehydrogenase 12-B [Fasciola gigantica]
MIISRVQEKLDAFAKELREQYGIQVKCVQVDFTQLDIYEKLKQEIDQLTSIACLVNNVGMVNQYPLSFPFSSGMSPKDIGNFVACNCVSMASMTHIVLPKLFQQNSGAALINISSFTGCTPLPYISLYSGTKAFDRQLSASLTVELMDHNVIVQTVCPMFVATAMVGNRRGFFVIDPREYARSALDMLGVENVTDGHWRHAIQAFVFSFLPMSCFIRSMEKKFLRSSRRSLLQ